MAIGFGKTHNPKNNLNGHKDEYLALLATVHTAQINFILHSCSSDYPLGSSIHGQLLGRQMSMV
jgi:hypothetical protein